MTSTARMRQREQTRRALLHEARALFATKGYAAVGLSEIVAAASVTKGALYHHFDSKADLFTAVLTQVQEEVGAQVSAAADAESDPWTQLTTGCATFLRSCADPSIQRIMLIDGPAVLGWHEWRAMDEANSARHLHDALQSLIDHGVLPPQPAAPLTRLLSGAMNEAALWLATDPGALPETVTALDRLLTGLRISDPTPDRPLTP
ncbi:TetR/AcrR family transcriptional regulator [Nocardia halotolerans]|uniref:TetR/AcrR family transcriptional regulator n=1 Tax=Nocardia halotolerans TaxID=1755878 RepID=A0ABV8VNX1_9NOCA